uniref:Uncharacterized protein n=1 Tax=Cacopsylla melanoneura TaxID=428564 RepID=A0A8D9AW47_9HEMI
MLTSETTMVTLLDTWLQHLRPRKRIVSCLCFTLWVQKDVRRVKRVVLMDVVRMGHLMELLLMYLLVNGPGLFLTSTPRPNSSTHPTGVAEYSAWTVVESKA